MLMSSRCVHLYEPSNAVRRFQIGEPDQRQSPCVDLAFRRERPEPDDLASFHPRQDIEPDGGQQDARTVAAAGATRRAMSRADTRSTSTSCRRDRLDDAVDA